MVLSWLSEADGRCVGLSPNMWPNNGDVGQISNEPEKNNLVFVNLWFVFALWAQLKTRVENTVCQRLNLISFLCRHKKIQSCTTCVLPWLRAWFPCGDAHRRGADSHRLIHQKYSKCYGADSVFKDYCDVVFCASWDDVFLGQMFFSSSLRCKSAPEDTPVCEIRYLSLNSPTLLARARVRALV